MKKVIKDAFGMLLVLGGVLLAGALVMGLAGRLYARAAASGADAIVRISFEGYEDLFSEPYKYYAVKGGRATELSERQLPGAVREEAASADMYSDEDADYWNVSVVNGGDELYLTADGKRDSGLGEGLYLTWSVRTENSEDPSEEDLAFFEDMAEYLSGGTAGAGYVGFMAIKHGDIYLVDDIRGGALYIVRRGAPVKAMEVPRYGSFSYCWFQ